MSQPAWRRYERFHRENVDADLDDEFSAHLALLIDAHLAAGLLIPLFSSWASPHSSPCWRS